MQKVIRIFSLLIFIFSAVWLLLKPALALKSVFACLVASAMFIITFVDLNVRLARVISVIVFLGTGLWAIIEFPNPEAMVALIAVIPTYLNTRLAQNKNNGRGGYVERNTFIVQMTKPQFERELDKFINKSNQHILLNWRILRRRRTEQERKHLSQMEEEHRNWECITNIAEADAIKLTTGQYRGIALELTEKENGLWIVIHPEGDKESLTIYEDGVFRHKGYKPIRIDPKAQEKMLKWSKTLD